MAQGVGNATAVTNGQDVFGGHLWGAVDYKGPSSYVSGGDAVDPRVFGFPNTIAWLDGSVDQTGTYQAVGLPVQNGITPWRLVWIALKTANGQTAGQEVTAGTNLSAITVRLNAVGY